ncbi:type VII secretion effector [Listeria grayi]|uniref:Type VII secretion effector n=1 Tax=Listeria grayi FSL F6-1183 TaxID=1265827 RepID=A0A829R497_LISGR|nr:TIGR04197 family type VII secretion effector [Listeria grayi]EUJ26005.1 hypothetical protein LMUR_13974 [Listeria grayi FSL F6-1183]VEI36534.1 type VII secretion effector [Listeria grayi]
MFLSNKQAAHAVATGMKQALQKLEMTRNPAADTKTTVKGNKISQLLAKKETHFVTNFQRAMEADIANIRHVANEFEAMDLGLGKLYNKKS